MEGTIVEAGTRHMLPVWGLSRTDRDMKGKHDFMTMRVRFKETLKKLLITDNFPFDHEVFALQCLQYIIHSDKINPDTDEIKTTTTTTTNYL